MIAPQLKRLYDEAKQNEAFKAEFKAADKEYFSPGPFIGDIKKSLFAMVYEGWLIARGEFNESKYE